MLSFSFLDNSYLVCEFLIELRLGAEKIKEGGETFTWEIVFTVVFFLNNVFDNILFSKR